jgi:hypothetical protein
MARYPYDDVLGAYIDADALVDIARDEAIGTNFSPGCVGLDLAVRLVSGA